MVFEDRERNALEATHALYLFEAIIGVGDVLAREVVDPVEPRAIAHAVPFRDPLRIDVAIGDGRAVQGFLRIPIVSGTSKLHRVITPADYQCKREDCESSPVLAYPARSGVDHWS